VYWFCECQSSTTGRTMVSKWIVWGRAVSCLLIKHPIETHLTPCDGIDWHQVSDILRVLILWVPEQHNWRTDGLQNELCEGEQSHAYIIKHPISTQIDFLRWKYTDINTVTLLLVLILWVPEWELGTDGLQMNIKYSDYYYLYWSVSARAGELGDGWSPNELCGESSLMLT